MFKTLIILAIAAFAVIGCSGQDTGDANKPVPAGGAQAPAGPAGSGPGPAPTTTPQ